MNISVIIPCYNAGPYLAQTIGSVLEQTRLPEEILVVDDGSTDNSGEVARRFEKPVRVVSKRCGGASRARNYGYSLASGDAVMFLDADDVLGPTALEAMAAALSEQPEQIAVCPWYRLEYVDEKWVRRPPSCEPRSPEQDDLCAWLSRWYHPPCSVLWSRAAYEQTGGWDQRAYVNDDGDIMMRAFVYGASLVRTDAGEAYYRRLTDSPHSVSGARFSERGRRSQIYVIQKIAHMLEERGMLEAYHAPLATAFGRYAAACKDEYPHLYEKCMVYMRHFGKVRGLRALRRAISLKLDHVRWKFRQIQAEWSRNDGDVSSAVSADTAEIRFGLRAAQVADKSSAQHVPPETGHVLDVRDRPAVSVIIPTYNRAHLVGRAVDSALAQTFSDIEVLVIDDGSSDGTSEVLAAYDDARLRYLRQPNNQGVSAARNRGMRAAQGQYIAFLDSDDVWLPDKLQRQIYRFRQASDDVGLVYCGAEIVEEDGQVAFFRPKHRGDVHQALLIKNIIHASSGVIIRCDVIPSTGFFDEEIPAIEDYDYWLRVSRFNRFEYVEEPLFRYFHHQDAVRKTSEIQKNLDAYECFFDKHCRAMQRAGVTHHYLRETAHRHLLNGRADRKGLRPLARRAVLWQPLAYDSYRFLLQTHVSEAHFRRLRSIYQDVRRMLNRKVLSSS